MTTNGHLEDDDLILYAMGALPDAEASPIAEHLAGDEGLRRRLADVRLTLGLYAEAVVEPVEVPAGSLDRLLASISQDRNVIQMPQRDPGSEGGKRRASASAMLSWTGWAVAAALLVAAGLEYKQSRGMRQSLAQQDSRLQQAIATAGSVSRERDALQKTLQEEAQRTAAAGNELSTYKDQSAALAAKVAAESTRARQESARANDLASLAAANAQESAQLRGTLANQASQVAQLDAQAANGRQVLDALSDPTALRVTLTVPKQKKTPSGRGTYVPSRGTLLFTASNLPPLAGKVYQLWLMPSDGSNPIPAGTFLPDTAGNATLVSTHFQRSIAAKGFAVTAEPTGGSQKPTLPILLAGL